MERCRHCKKKYTDGDGERQRGIEAERLTERDVHSGVVDTDRERDRNIETEREPVRDR